MAAITVLTPSWQETPGYAKLETVAILDQTDASTTVSKCFAVPAWATWATFTLDITTLGGTTPSFDFDLQWLNIADTFPPDSADTSPLRDGFNYTAKTGTAPLTSTIHVGPYLTEELTGSATADDTYALAVPLPPWIGYSYTTTDSADDADYDATISVYFRG